MNVRVTRGLILALLLLALAPGAALAACLVAGPADCCCAGCPTDETTGITTTPCCEMTDAATLPTPAPLALAAAQSATVIVALVDESAVVATTRSAGNFSRMTRSADPPAAVPLFTLHAAFLI